MLRMYSRKDTPFASEVAGAGNDRPERLRTASGRTAAPSSRSVPSTTARSTAFSSWRTLPGQAKSRSTCIAAVEKRSPVFPFSLPYFFRKCWVSAGMSSRRSRSDGRWMLITSRRK